MAKIGLSWDDACIVSAHGRECSLIPLIRTNRKVFAILGTKDKVAEIAGGLHAYGMDDVLLYVGENLSYKNEKIFVKKPAELLDYQGTPLVFSVLIMKKPFLIRQLMDFRTRHLSGEKLP